MKKILIVEDDKDISRAMAIRLRTAGYEVSVAFDALLGMTTAVKEKPDLAILDMSMPGGNGLDLAERMQSLGATAGTPFILITASKRPGLREKALGLGATAFLEKPYNATELMSAVDRVLA